MNTTNTIYSAIFFFVFWNVFILWLFYEHLCDKTELLIFALQDLPVLHGSVADARTYLSAWREQNCVAYVYKQIKVNIPTV